MKIKVLVVGQLATNCYLLEDEKTSLAAVIDPGDEAERILDALAKDGMDVPLILLTHGHFDHILAAAAIRRRFPKARVYVHPGDANGAGNCKNTPAGEVGELFTYDEGDELTLGGLKLRVMHTPGHSDGSVVLQTGGVLFTGDTLFAGTCGRTDLPNGDDRKMLASLKRLSELEGDYQVLPGHGSGSTLETERQYNPYMRMAAEM